MAAQWPSTVPFRPLQGSLQIRPAPNVIRGPADVGLGQRRRRYLGKTEAYRGTLVLDGAQVQMLRDFFDQDCAGGALPFEMYDWALLTQGVLTYAEFAWEQEPDTTHRLGLTFHVPLVLTKTS